MRKPEAGAAPFRTGLGLPRFGFRYGVGSGTGSAGVGKPGKGSAGSGSGIGSGSALSRLESKPVSALRSVFNRSLTTLSGGGRSGISAPMSGSGGS